MAVTCVCLSLLGIVNTANVSKAAQTVTPAMPVITYDAKAQEFYVDDAILVDGKLPDLFTEFKNCMPGDMRVQKVMVEAKNLGNNTATISLLAENADDKYKDLMQNITCQIVSEESNITKTIWDRIILGNFKNDESEMVTMTLTFPIEMDNRFQNFIGQVDWYLDVELFPVKTPQTGDSNQVSIYLIGGSISLLIIFFILIKKMKKNKKN